ncbi:hypothetical protein EYF80_052296 [Liparis tanakae]|uniref:Uncharacterized protein n=1 Tax=Liparis tanakae TaxID=230148 RepID=A0A4Z2F9J0_9TELE|nr:hypothetical protein EYF80_052296 [Liparis tanakae]
MPAGTSPLRGHSVLKVERPECILYESPEVLRSHSWRSRPPQKGHGEEKGRWRGGKPGGDRRGHRSTGWPGCVARTTHSSSN